MLSSILAARNKEGSKSLKILLCESAIAVYVALLVTSSSQFLPNQLYRLVMNQLTADVWGLVFGGGTKLIILDEEAQTDARSTSVETSPLTKEDEKKRVDTARMKWNFRLLGKKATVPTQSSPGKFVQQELFIPPQMTLYDYFLKKVIITALDFCIIFIYITHYCRVPAQALGLWTKRPYGRFEKTIQLTAGL